jgi:thiol-disulfide isomerase/thioredoxin
MKLKPMHFFIILVLVIVGGIVGTRIWSANQPGQYDAFAQCIADAGATFFGAFWCPHCQEQKRMFGNSERLLPYVECSTPDGQNQTQICIDEGIRTYPTWEFADGSRMEGVTELAELAEKTGCELSPS